MPPLNLATGLNSSGLFILAALVVAAVLLGGFWYGSRRLRSRRSPGPPTHLDPTATGEAQRGQSWQTIDDDPEQGAPSKKLHDEE
ncbi:hypothetical protein [Streptomyces sp. NPDC008139]|uniref:hypothetical protein n=1 Tax=Streptomyces sp. NPDC008139 TaxID=3364814 RepID=UPI0036DFAFCD